MAEASTTHAPRRPEDGTLYQIAGDQFETFRGQAASLRDGEGLPRFVEHEFRDFLRCGWLAGGFARFRFGGCGLDVPAGPRCGGRLRLIVLIEEAAVIDRILRHLGLPASIPAPRPARAPPLPADVPDGSGWSDPPSGFDACS